VREYGHDLADRLAGARFDVSVERPQREMPGEALARYGLNAAESVFLCEKPPEPRRLSPSPS
jgi:hypothetical protein